MVLPLWVKIIFFMLIIITFFTIFNTCQAVRPTKSDIGKTPGQLGIDYENVTFKTEDGLTLTGWFIPGKSDTTIIVGHGYPFSKKNILSHVAFLHPDFNLLLFDFRYFGESEGSYTTVGFNEQKDLLAAINFLKQEKKNKSKTLGAFGFSMSASTFLLTQTNDLQAIVADSPYATLDEMVKKTFSMFPGFTKEPFVLLTNIITKIFLGFSPKEVSVVEAISQKQIPILIIHGTADTYIPVENSKQIYEASDKNTTELWLVEGANHIQAYTVQPAQYEKRVKTFFEKNL